MDSQAKAALSISAFVIFLLAFLFLGTPWLNVALTDYNCWVYSRGGAKFEAQRKTWCE